MKKIILTLLCVSVLYLPAFSHGIDYSFSSGESIIIKVSFGENEPMSYAAVKIFSPENNKIEHQNGRTDKNGLFSFVPNKTGEWTVMVTDDTGHGLKEKIKVDKKLRIDEMKSNNLNVMQKLIAAVCAIWGIIGTALYFKSKQKAV
jgi:nickel transport protein